MLSALTPLDFLARAALVYPETTAVVEGERRFTYTEFHARVHLVVSLGKQAYYTQIDLDQPKAYAYAKEVMSMNALAADAQEGMGAFLEKRKPCWVGK